GDAAQQGAVGDHEGLDAVGDGVGERVPVPPADGQGADASGAAGGLEGLAVEALQEVGEYVREDDSAGEDPAAAGWAAHDGARYERVLGRIHKTGGVVGTRTHHPT